MAVETTLHVVVHYPAAKKPYEVPDASRAETIGVFQTQVLTAFGLSGGPTPEGGSVTYTLYHDKTLLENPAQTLGEVAGDRPELQLKLAQQVTQGA